MRLQVRCAVLFLMKPALHSGGGWHSAFANTCWRLSTSVQGQPGPRADTVCYGDEGRRSVFKTAVVLSIKDCWYR
jgi:hypothetical protein